MKKLFNLIFISLLTITFWSCKFQSLLDLDPVENKECNIEICLEDKGRYIKSKDVYDTAVSATLFKDNVQVKHWGSNSTENIFQVIQKDKLFHCEPGTYDFKLDFYNQNGNLIYQGNITQKEIIPGSNNSILFTMEKQTGTGSLNITLKWNNIEKVTRVVAGLFSFFDDTVAVYIFEDITINSTAATYIKDNVPTGNYIVKFNLYGTKENNEQKISTYSDVVVIEKDIESKKELLLDDINSIYKINIICNGIIVKTLYHNGNECVILPNYEELYDLVTDFQGIYEDSNCSGNQIEIIAAGLKKDIDLYIKGNIFAQLKISDLEEFLKNKVGYYKLIIEDENVDFDELKEIILQFPKVQMNLEFTSSLITEIPEYAFYGCSSLKSITIPDSVTSIGGSAFSSCSSLESITIPDSVTAIGYWAFNGCSSLESITIPDSVTSIESDAFYGCSSLESITIPDSVTSIESVAFCGCSSLKSITIPDSVTAIGYGAFSGCSSLESIMLPDSVTSIGDYAFNGCSSLESITIPNSVTAIGYGTFTGCSSLESITIPDSVTSIESNAFNDCSSIIFNISPTNENYYSSEDKLCLYEKSTNRLIWGAGNIVIPNTQTEIPDHAYTGMEITSIVIPDSVTAIGYEAFAGCSSLESIMLPDSVTSIGDYAFNGCSSLESITIPDSVTSIESVAFYGCSSLESITIPDSVTSIGNSAFYGCSSIIFNISPTNENYYVSENKLCLYEKSTNRLVYCSGNIVIQNNQTGIPAHAYSGMGITSIVIPDSVTSIGDWAFSGCSSLESIILPDLVTSIGDRAFSECSSLKSITIPDSVTAIGTSTFHGCSSIIFNISPTNENYYVSENKLCLYEKSTNILVYGSGNIVIPNTQTEIPDLAYYGMGITSITIPDSVTAIGYGAFEECSSLSTINYTGTKAQWNSIDKENVRISSNVIINYNYVP